MTGAEAAAIVRHQKKYFLNVAKDLSPEHSDFRPTPEMMTAAQQIHHTAHTMYWFREGAFGKGFDMDFERLAEENNKPITVEKALQELEDAYESFAAFLETLTEAELAAPIPPNPIFGESPRSVVLMASNDHTAHHRGALSVYLRLLGKTPTMPYSE